MNVPENFSSASITIQRPGQERPERIVYDAFVNDRTVTRAQPDPFFESGHNFARTQDFRLTDAEQPLLDAAIGAMRASGVLQHPTATAGGDIAEGYAMLRLAERVPGGFDGGSKQRDYEWILPLDGAPESATKAIAAFEALAAAGAGNGA